MVLTVGWRRGYPERLHPGSVRDTASQRAVSAPDAELILDLLRPATWRRAARRIADAGAEVAVVQWVHPIHAPVIAVITRMLRRRGIGTVLVCHNVEPHESNAVWRTATRVVLRQAGALIVHAASLRDGAHELAPRVPIVQAFMPAFTNVADDLGTASAEAIAAVRRSLGVGDRKVLLVFGYLRPYKGAEDAVAAMAHVHSDAVLVVAGECWGDPGRFDRAAAAAGVGQRVVFDLKYQANESIPGLFGAADVVVLPYRSATQSAVATLAFAYGRPVVATDVGGLSELVQEGVTGALARPNDPGSLADAIERVLATKRPWGPALAATGHQLSFGRYVTLVHEAARLAVPARKRRRLGR